MIDIEEMCRDVYRKTRAFAPIAALHTQSNMVFEILLGPPKPNARVAFIGFQPGGNEILSDRGLVLGFEDFWSSNFQYTTDDWPLARRMRDVYGTAVLSDCIALNAIFVKAPNIAAYRQTVPSQVRGEIARFCLQSVKALLDAIAPREIVVIGHQTMDLFGASDPCLTSPRGRVLVRQGMVFERPAYATLHLTGARIAVDDRASISNFLISRLPPKI